MPRGSRLSLPGYEWLRQELLSEANRANLGKVEQLRCVAQDLGVTLAQLAIAWCLQNPHVSSVILGVSKASQIRDNLGALELADRLGPDVMDRIESVLQNKPAPPQVD